MQLKQDRKLFDVFTFLISLTFPFLLSFILSQFLHESFNEILKISIWMALPFAFFFRLFIILNVRKNYKKIPWSHFTSTGFYLSQLDLLKIINLAVHKGEKTKIPKYGGSYFKLSYPEGTEFWVSINSESKLASVTPFFRGKNVNKLTITDLIENPHSMYNGAFYAWSQNKNIDGEGEQFPLVFDNPDFIVHSGNSFPQTANITLTAFPTSIKVYENIEDFQKSHLDTDCPEVKSFTPGETTTSSQDLDNKLPKSHASFNGIVKEAQLMENSETLMKFYWLSVETLSLVVDVVIDKRMLKSVPQKGNVVNITGLLAGDWINHS